MLSEFETLLEAAFPWIMLAFCALQLYRSARIYRRTRRVTAQLLAIFALGIAFGCWGVAHFRDSIPRGLRITADLVALIILLVSLVPYVHSLDRFEPKPPA